MNRRLTYVFQAATTVLSTFGLLSLVCIFFPDIDPIEKFLKPLPIIFVIQVFTISVFDHKTTK
jgi:hypothetical protein